MTDYDCLVAVASWEERFAQGIQHTIKTTRFSSAVIFHSLECADKTSSNRADVVDLLNSKNIKAKSCDFEFGDPKITWEKIVLFLNGNVEKSSRVLFDISTSPREIIWFVLHHLQRLQCSVSFIYYPPENYGTWQSRDADEPRLIFRRSGVSFPDRKTVIFVVTGFDVDRVVQIANRYEPAKLLLAVQAGDCFDTMKRNELLHRQCFENNPSVDFFAIDAYGDFDKSYKDIETKIVPFLDEYNVIATSLGPKPSAVTLFLLNQNYPDIGLVYAPSREYAIEYSTGIRLDNVVPIRVSREVL